MAATSPTQADGPEQRASSAGAIAERTAEEKCVLANAMSTLRLGPDLRNRPERTVHDGACVDTSGSMRWQDEVDTVGRWGERRGPLTRQLAPHIPDESCEQSFDGSVYPRHSHDRRVASRRPNPIIRVRRPPE